MKIMLDQKKALSMPCSRQESMSAVTDSEKVEEKTLKKCFYENSGTCRKKEKCKYLHPKKTCQTFSKMGSCLDVEKCQLRHPKESCSRFLSSGSCHLGDRCRERHPLERTLQSISQSHYFRKDTNTNPHINFLGTSTYPSQGQGSQMTQEQTPKSPQVPWTPPLQNPHQNNPSRTAPYPPMNVPPPQHPGYGWGGKSW